jgi:hypothetical protein
MRTVVPMLLALLVTPVAPAEAGERMRTCRTACREAIVACFTAGDRLSYCRRTLLKDCLRSGVVACEVTACPDSTSTTTTTVTSNTSVTQPGMGSTTTNVTPTTVRVTTTLPQQTLRVRVVDVTSYGTRVAGTPGPCVSTLAILVEVEGHNLRAPGSLQAIYPTRDCGLPFTTIGIDAAVRSAYFQRVFPALTTDPAAAQLCQDVAVPTTGRIVCSLFAPDSGLANLTTFSARVAGCGVDMLLGCQGTVRDNETCPSRTVVQAEMTCP